MLALRMDMYTPITTDYYRNSMLLVPTEELTEAIGTKGNRLHPPPPPPHPPPPPPNYIHATLRKRLTLLSPLTKPKPKTQAEMAHGQ